MKKLSSVAFVLCVGLGGMASPALAHESSALPEASAAACMEYSSPEIHRLRVTQVVGWSLAGVGAVGAAIGLKMAGHTHPWNSVVFGSGISLVILGPVTAGVGGLTLRGRCGAEPAYRERRGRRMLIGGATTMGVGGALVVFGALWTIRHPINDGSGDVYSEPSESASER